MQSLKDKRLQIGKEIKDVVAVTRIKQSYLKAIEEEDFASLPAPVYSKAYIKQYADFLNINPEVTLQKYEEYLSNVSKKNQPDLPQSEIPITSQEESAKEKRPINYKPILKIAMIILIVLISLSFLLWSQSKQSDIKEIAQYSPPQITSKETENPTNTDTKDSQQSTETPNLPTKQEDTPPMIETKQDKPRHILSLMATEKVWIQITIDDKEKKEITLSAGDTVSYNATTSFKLLIGNAGGVKLNFNGKQIDKLGESGSVIRLRLPDEDRRT